MSETSGINRRGVLRGGVAAAAGAVVGGAAGVTAGYRFRDPLRARHIAAGVAPLRLPDGVDAFRARAADLLAARLRQTADDARALARRRAAPLFGEVRVWELIERLALCVDSADTRLFAVSQYLHVQQILAAMEANGVDDPDLLLAALLHDLGKVALLAGVPAVSVLWGSRRLSDGELGAGLDALTFAFGHGEIGYQRLRDRVPPHLAWLIRYHNVDIEDALPYMTAEERGWSERYLVPFRRFDAGFKTPYFEPRIEMARYRELVESRFPKPIPF